ncbi:MAG: polysaccharide biosynthesis/export family protein [Terracidiphilus sp.]|jgi:polysaccharide export outer membrane protein
MAMRKSRLTINRGLLFFLGVALLLATMNMPANAQGSQEGLVSSVPALHSSSSSGRSVPQSGGPTLLPKDFSELRIVSGDLLSVSVYDNPELTGSYRVDPEGDLSLPLCGKVNLRGLTMSEAAKRIEAAFKDRQILNQPQVNVDVLQYAGQYVTVMGEVLTPGRVALIAPTRLGEILAQVGGVTQLAGARIKIRHGADDAAPEEEVPYSRSQGNRETDAILLRPGDTITIPRVGIVYVLGAVNRPGGYVMQEDGKLNVAQALALSGGTVLQAKTGGLRVIRRNPDGTVLDFPLSYDSIAKGTQTPLQLQAQDIVYVPMSKTKSILTSTQTILSSAATAAILR